MHAREREALGVSSQEQETEERSGQKLCTSITSIFGHIHGILNIDEKNWFLYIAYKLRDESNEPK